MTDQVGRNEEAPRRAGLVSKREGTLRRARTALFAYIVPFVVTFGLFSALSYFNELPGQGQQCDQRNLACGEPDERL